ncbi:hypothetical protein KC19_10G134000 [Ceratodon purpureus]|uniref:Uncharacterized protein n=1 Tax=Ceratodon purpureus TaxID=3225 RepID=A0A8T0GLK1_CERPU|nr:hypothetical protein KC19_10G134000 [Ceratodon purpureus]
MESYLKILVITLPALTIVMGGLLLVVFMCLRSWSRVKANLPVPQCSVTTQSDESQVNHELRDKLMEEAIAKMQMILSDEFRTKQTTKISQEEFSKLSRTKRSLDPESSPDMTNEKQKRQEMEFVCNISGIAPLTNSLPTINNLAPLKTTNSFATLWAEELQKSGNIHSIPDTPSESEIPEKKPEVETLPIPPQHSIVTCTRFPPASQHDCMLTVQEDFNEADKMIEVKPSNKLRQINDLQLFLQPTSSNPCQSIVAFSMDCKPEPEITDSICLRSRHDDLGFDPSKLPSVVRASIDAPQLLKGGASNDHNFVWRLDIDDDCAEPSPPNTPVRRQHLCRGVRFQVAEHPPTMNIIHLDPEQGYGWRGPDWKETFGKYHVFKEHEGPSEYRKRRQSLPSDQSKRKYYKSIEVDAKRKWKNIKARCRRAREYDAIQIAIREDIHKSAEWKKHLKEKTLSYSQSFSGDTSENESEEYRRRGTVKSMLATSSSSLDSDDSMIAKFNRIPRCKKNHNIKYPKNINKINTTSS